MIARRSRLLTLAVAGVLFGACSDHGMTAPGGDQPGSSAPLVAQFDTLWARYDAQYAYFDYKGINWDSRSRLSIGGAPRLRRARISS